MDVLKAVQNYVTKMVTQTSSIKVLLLDTSTTPIISLAATQSSLLSHEIYLTDSVLNASRERMSHLKCICFLRPTEDSLAALEDELRSPKYGEYWLYFSNVLKKSEIERLAEADEHEVVREVQEYFADYAPITTSHFSLAINPSPPSSIPTTTTLSSLIDRPGPSSRRGAERYTALYGDSPSSWNTATDALQSHVQGLMAVLLSLKKKPVIRYERMSGMGRKLGQELLYHIQNEQQLFDFRPTHPPPILLILDRRNDPVTPLLTQWTYQAMVHETLGISNGRVDLSGSPDVTPENKEIVLNPEQDLFYAKNLYANFGDLGANIKAYVGDFQARSQSSKMQAGQIETVQDMKRFLEAYPEHRKLGGNVSKHVALVGELSRLVAKRQLLEVSELEQSLASNESHAADLKNVQQMILAESVPEDAKLRLAILYALRYQKFGGNAILPVIDLLKQQPGISEADASLVHVMLNFAGADQRQDDLFANSNFFSRGKSALKGLKGVENVYTQHTPHLAETIEALLKGRLKESSYPFLEGQAGVASSSLASSSSNPGGAGTGSALATARPTEIVVFVVGGTTYEEARTVALMNEKLASGQGWGGQGQQPQHGAKIVLGGTCVHNSQTFLDMLRDAASRFPASAAAASLALRTQAAQRAAGQNQGGINLNLGGISVNVPSAGGGGGSALEEIGDAARDGVRTLFGKVRDAF